MGGMLVECPCFGCPEPVLYVSKERPLLVQNQKDIRGPVARARFSRRYWDADFYGLAILAEFAQQPWASTIVLQPPPATDSSETEAELATLLQLAEAERPVRISEIVAQDGSGFLNYFLRLLMMSEESHPATFKVIKAAARVSEMLMAHYKVQYSRARPQQLAPALMPPIPAQLHPAYPSGHAMMSRLIALCLSDVVPDEYHAALLQLSAQIAENREIAGVHFPSDSRGGQSAAEQAHKILASGPIYADLLKDARDEWSFVP